MLNLVISDWLGWWIVRKDHKATKEYDIYSFLNYFIKSW